ncbi:uncharacterized protein VTP21DRAFT_7112 [Calcarisporiella thermophila]|uniref:uncharacterized protein n=1 Tax=Calcarisporiella thermophila TaxID=911321 RepID=UPI0037422EB5
MPGAMSSLPLSGRRQPRTPLNSMTLIEKDGIRFLITDAPSNSNLHLYIKEFERHNVTDVVRCCEPTYSKERLGKIQVHDWIFGDGEAPPVEIVNQWLNLVEERFSSDSSACIATHCIAGLGRAPVLVALALIERGMAPLDAVAYLRRVRPGCINKWQLEYIENYKRRSKSKCVIC